MLWINWIPEILIIVLLLAALFFQSFKRIGNLSIPISFSLISFFALFFMWFRSEGFTTQAPYLVFNLDSLSYYGRSIGMFWLGYGCLYLAFLSAASMKNRIKMMTYFIFFAAFLDGLFLAKPILMFLLSWLGCLISLSYMMVIESSEKEMRSAFLKQTSVMMILTGIVATLMSFFKESKELVILLGWIISFGFPLTLIQIQSFLARAPLTQSWFTLWIYFAGGVFWLRFGLPLLSDHKEVLGVIFSLTALHAGYVALRTKQVSIWLGAVLFALVHLSWLALLLDPEQGMNLFFTVGIVGVPLFTFAGYAFHQDAPALKKSKVIVSLALVGFLPVVMADLYFSLIQSLIEKSFLIFSGIGMVIWVMLCFSVIQQLGQLLTQKKGQEVDSVLSSILLIVFLSSVISLTCLKLPLLQLLNHHPN